MYVGGRCDAIVQNEDGTKRIIEIKNRMHKLFNKVREYERVQLMAYLYINGIKQGELVERYETQVRRYDVDSKYWETITSEAKPVIIGRLCGAT